MLCLAFSTIILAKCLAGFMEFMIYFLRKIFILYRFFGLKIFYRFYATVLKFSDYF